MMTCWSSVPSWRMAPHGAHHRYDDQKPGLTDLINATRGHLLPIKVFFLYHKLEPTDREISLACERLEAVS